MAADNLTRDAGAQRSTPTGAAANADLRQSLFAPRSVAIVGQSDDPSKTAGRPLKFLRQMGYAGRVYPINSRREQVLGERAWPSLAALPEIPEHAYIVTPTEAAVEAVEECGRLGVKVATVLADGFAETGREGLARESRLREICARTGIRLVGPVEPRRGRPAQQGACSRRTPPSTSPTCRPGASSPPRTAAA